MTVWLTVARASAIVNSVLLLGLGWVWVRSYQTYGAVHTLGLLVIGAFLLAENALRVYLYTFQSGFVGWFVNAPVDIRIEIRMLCGLELGALLTLTRLTWH